ncbi:hypothetical protein EJB05_30335, partial [Eragrostis curvula]
MQVASPKAKHRIHQPVYKPLCSLSRLLNMHRSMMARIWVKFNMLISLFPSYGYPTFPTISLVSNIQAEGQNKPAAMSYRTLTDSPIHSSSIEKSQDTPSRNVTMTPHENIEKLRPRQQMLAGSGSDTVVPQTYSPRNRNPDSLGSLIVIDENVNTVFLPELIPSSHEEVHKSSVISDDPFIEENKYYEFQDALGKAIYYSPLVGYQNSTMPFETVCLVWLIVQQSDKLLVTEVALTRLLEMKMKPQKMIVQVEEK